MGVIKAQRVAVLVGRLPPMRCPLHWFECVRALKEFLPETTTAIGSGSGRTTGCGEIMAGGGASSAAQYQRAVVGLKLACYAAPPSLRCAARLTAVAEPLVAMAAQGVCMCTTTPPNNHAPLCFVAGARPVCPPAAQSRKVLRPCHPLPVLIRGAFLC
jgi:hypothetical protein